MAAEESSSSLSWSWSWSRSVFGDGTVELLKRVEKVKDVHTTTLLKLLVISAASSDVLVMEHHGIEEEHFLESVCYILRETQQQWHQTVESSHRLAPESPVSVASPT